MASIHFFVGIDIPKNTLDISILKDCVLLTHEKIENTIEAIRSWLKTAFVNYQMKRSNTLFCLESTGLYGSYILKQLGGKKANVWVESPLQIKRSLGLQRGKNDKIDSLRIAQYCYINRHNFHPYDRPRPIIEQLKLFLSLRQRIISSHMQLSIALKESKNYLKKSTSNTVYGFCRQSLHALQTDKKATEAAILELVNSDERLTHLFTILTSIHCIGKITATELLIATNEFKKFDSAKKFACYCGVAPFEHSSGISLKGSARVSRLANIKSKQHFI